MPERIKLPAYENIADILGLDPDKLPNPLFTLVDNRGQLSTHTMADLRDGAYRWAAALSDKVEPGGRVILSIPTSVDFMQAFFGVHLVGGVAVPTPHAFHRQAAYLEEYLKARASVVDDCGAVVLATHSDQREVGEQLAARCAGLKYIVTPADLPPSSQGFRPRLAGPNDLAILQYTSGSTGTPKGVELTHNGLIWNLEAIGEGMRAIEGDKVVSWLPLYHDMGLIGGWLWPPSNGCAHVQMATEVFLTNPYFWLQAITQIKATITVAPNFGYALCVKRVKEDQMASLDLSTLRIALSGAEPIDAAVVSAFHDKFAAAGCGPHVIVPVYGLAEATLAVAFAVPTEPVKVRVLDRKRLEADRIAVEVPPGTAGGVAVVCVGEALLDGEVRIVDPERRGGGSHTDLADGHEGEILVRSGSLMRGYYRRPEESAAALVAGWLHTGDLGYLDGGELYVTGRIKDLIITYGRNFYPHDIEWLSAEVRGVRTGCVAAFGVPNSDTSTEEIAVVAETRARDKEELRRIRREIRSLLIATIECNPKHVVLVPPRKVPKTTSGKIRRVEARRLFLEDGFERLI